MLEARPGWQVMAQVCLGEFLASDDAEAYACINAKRVDFAGVKMATCPDRPRFSFPMP